MNVEWKKVCKAFSSMPRPQYVGYSFRHIISFNPHMQWYRGTELWHWDITSIHHSRDTEQNKIN